MDGSEAVAAGSGEAVKAGLVPTGLVLCGLVLSGCSFLYTAADVSGLLDTPQQLCERAGDTWRPETYNPRTLEIVTPGQCERKAR